MMKPFKKITGTVLSLALSGLLALQFGGCTQSSPVSADPAISTKHTAKTIKRLKANTIRLSKVFDVTQTISAANGGTMTVGDDTTGYCQIAFDPGDLSSDTAINFWWDSNTFTAEFAPHGAQFNDSVYVRLSYKDADLGGTPEADLKIWYYNETDDVWEVVGDQVNTTLKYVEGWTTHFSKYAIGGE